MRKFGLWFIVDLVTTTLIAQLVELLKGRAIGAYTSRYPQKKFSSDGSMFYISDNNYRLQIQKYHKNVDRYGLSALLPLDTIDFVEINWIKNINNKLLRYK